MPGKSIGAAHMDMFLRDKQFLAASNRIEQSMRKQARASRGLNSRLGRLNRTLSRFGSFAGFTGLAGGFAALGFGISGVIRDVASFNEMMVRVQYLVGISEKEIKEFETAIFDLSKKTGRPIAELADSLFDITSAGLRTGDAVDVLTASAKASVLGLGTTKSIADAVTNALNTWGASAQSAEEITATLWATVREGKAAPETVAPAIGRLGAVAAALGVELGELLGAFAELSKTQTPELAVTRLGAVLKTLIKPSEQAIKTLKQYGITVEELQSLVEEDFFGALARIDEAVPDNQLGRLFRDTEGLAAFLALTGDNLESTSRTINRVIKTTVDDFETAYTGASESVNNAWSRATANMTDQAARFANVGLAPITNLLADMLSYVNDLVSGFGLLFDPKEALQNTSKRLDNLANEFAVNNNPFNTYLKSVEGTLELQRLYNKYLAEIQGDNALHGTANSPADLLEADRLARASIQSRFTPPSSLDSGAIITEPTGTQTTTLEPIVVTPDGETPVFPRRPTEPLPHPGQIRTSAPDAALDFKQHLEQQNRSLEQQITLLKARASGDSEVLVTAQANQDILNRQLQVRHEIERVESALAQARADGAETAELEEQLILLRQQESQLGTMSAESYPELIRQAAKLTDAHKKVNEEIQRMNALEADLEGAFNNFFSGLIAGTQNAEEAFRNLARAIIDAIAQALIIQPIANAIAGGLAGFINPGANAATVTGPRASGGAVVRGQPYIVGERGPELFYPDSSGIISSSGEGGGQTININIDSTDGPGVRRALAEALPAIKELAKSTTIETLQRPGAGRRATLGG